MELAIAVAISAATVLVVRWVVLRFVMRDLNDPAHYEKAEWYARKRAQRRMSPPPRER